MGLKEQVEDAVALAQAGRRHSALGLLLMSVGASSRRMFTKAQISSDNEAFCQFLGGRIKKLLLGRNLGPDVGGSSGIFVDCNGAMMTPEKVLYKYVRNGIIHQGEIDKEVTFEDPAPVTSRPARLSIEISNGNGAFKFGSGWLEFLGAAVSGARCNAQEFGFTYKDVQLKPGNSEDALRASCVNAGISAGRFEVLRSLLVCAEPGELEDGADGGIRAWFRRLRDLNLFSGGALVGLANAEPPLCDHAGDLTSEGIAVLRRIVDAHEIVQGP